MNWLITGGCGFIGVNLVHNLVSEGNHFIRIVDNLSVGTRQDLAQVCEFIETDPTAVRLRRSSLKAQLIIGDILDDTLSAKVTKGMDIIVHLAANTDVGASIEDPRSDCSANIIGTLNYLEAARKNLVKRFIFASSSATTGECEPPIHENLAPHPISPYGASKLAGEGYCCAYYRAFGLQTVALRFGNVYGLHSKHKNSVVAKFVKQAMEGKALEIYGDGNQTRDFIYIDDLIRAIRLAASVSGVGGEIFQIATNTETTVAEMADQLLTILANRGIKNIKIKYSAPRKGDIHRNYSDTSKAKRLLGWCPQIHLSDGLQRVVEWFTRLDSNKCRT